MPSTEIQAVPTWDVGATGEATIFEGLGKVELGSNLHDARVRVWFSWELGVRVRAEGRDCHDPRPLESGDGTIRVIVGDLPPFRASVLDSTIELPEGVWSLDGNAVDDAVLSGSRVRHVSFQLANFTKTWGRQGFALSGAAHRIELAPHPEVRERAAALKLTRRGATTYLGTLARRDGEPMGWDEATEELTAAQYFLSFAAGDWSPVLLPVGHDDDGRPVAVGLRSPLREAYAGRLSWCTAFHLDALPDMWSTFNELWAQPDLRQLLQLGLPLYFEAQHGDLLETRLVHAVTLLEALAWDRLVRTDGLDPTKVDGKKMAWRIRRLLEAIGAPVDVPQGLGALEAWRRGEDGPTVVTRLRHAIVHPTSLKDIFEASPAVKHDVLNLAMWYADLALLRLFGHAGDHLRRAQKLPIWAGRGEAVPWAQDRNDAPLDEADRGA
jgi:hypothetical protein